MKALVLSAGDITYRFKFNKFIFRCPGLIPIGNGVLANRVVEALNRLGISCEEIFLVTEKENKSPIVRFIKLPINFLFLENKTAGVVDTLNQAIQKLLEESEYLLQEELLILPVTTVPTSIPKKAPGLVLSRQKFFNPSFSTVEKDGNSIKFYPKNSPFKKGHGFTGVFRINIKDLRKILNKVNLLDDLMEVIIKGKELGLDWSLDWDDWLDFGHEINIPRSKALLISSRAFNRIKTDYYTNILIKQSSDEKLNSEVNFYRQLPSELKALFPFLIETKINNGQIAVMMEYYGYKTLSEWSIFYDVTFEEWTHLWEKLKNIIVRFLEYKPKKEEAYTLWENIKEFHLVKLKKRLKEFANQLTSSGLDWVIKAPKIGINGQELHNIYSIIPEIENAISKLYSSDPTPYIGIVHGDLCFSNILWDPDSGIVKLLDPRGNWGKIFTIYGDIRYDIAKLAHSIWGLYDLFMCDLYSLNINKHKKTINYFIFDEFFTNKNKIENCFSEMLNYFGFNVREIKFLMGLLFVTMPPLHFESKERQIAFYVHGIRILNEALKGGSYEDLH